MFEKLLYLIKESFFIIRFWCHLLWIKFNRWLFRILDIDPKKNHKIVVIGDGFAEGLGDYVILGSQAGLAQYLTSEIKNDLNIRQKWKCYNAGHTGSSLKEWLPTCVTKPEKMSWLCHTTLFNDTFVDSSYADCEIVIYIGGPSDVYDENYVNHLDELCKCLSQLNKIIYITPPPYIPSIAFGESYSNLRLNTQKFVKDRPYVKLGPELFIPQLQKKESLCFDKVHYNSHGYSYLASIYFPAIRKDLVKIEFDTIRNIFGVNR